MQAPDIAREATSRILARMEKGFYLDDEYRHDPLVWDIGNGWCHEWAIEFIHLWHEHSGHHWDDQVCTSECPTVEWRDRGYINDQGEPYQADHHIIQYQGRFYDAEAPEGVADIWDLPFWKQEDRP